MNPNQFTMDNLFQADQDTLAALFRPGEVHVPQEELARRIAARSAAMRKLAPKRPKKTKDYGDNPAATGEAFRKTGQAPAQAAGSPPKSPGRVSPFMQAKQAAWEANNQRRDDYYAQRGMRLVPGLGPIPEFQWQAMQDQARAESERRAMETQGMRERMQRDRDEYERGLAREEELRALEKEERQRRENRELQETARRNAPPPPVEDLVRQIIAEEEAGIGMARRAENEAKRQQQARKNKFRTGDAQPVMPSDGGTPYDVMGLLAAMEMAGPR